MPSDLTISQRVTLLTESAQSNQVVRVLPAVQAYSFVSCFFASGVGGGGKPGKSC